ncbi:hypothetical protein RJ640_020204 [Escallonia rubra]|uniref:Retrovirus-related Pol polyprotein from transposon TNT 1-94-like beta-barrel domain-containing protein n=1 Tax=Escallonia rubra TaxID=112253 RepID=A0AA88UJ83_9ASTE|nr:hypothetical protein RJ640_020204 [Escallonia rubra]
MKALSGNKPEKMDADDWKECEATAVSTIRLSLALEVKYSVLKETSPLAIWSKLEKIYMAKSLTNRLYLKKQLYQLRMDDGSDIRDHLNAFSKIPTKLLNVEVKIDEEDLAIILLSSLPSAYETLRTTLLVGKDTLTVDEVTTTLLETNSLKDSGGCSHANGLVARADPKTDSRRNKNWQRGKRNGKDKVRSQSRARDGVICHYCKVKGHYKNQCQEMRKDLKELQVKKKPTNTASVAKEKSNEAIGIGTIKVRMFDGIVRILTEVRHIPELRKSLISMGALDSLGYGFSAQGGVLKVSKGVTVVMKGQKLGNLYRMVGNTITGGVAVTTPAESNTDSATLWHLRLRHISERARVF